MNHFIPKLQKELNSKLQNIDLEETNTINKAQKSIICIRTALCQLKSFVLNYSFKSEDEEIHFFKEIKPEFFSKLIYFVKISNIESRRPSGSREMQESFLRYELEKINFFFNNHLQFYQYYRMNSTFLDDKCFLRGKEDLHLYQESLMFYIDPDFSTSHDYMVAKVMANDLLEVYLNTELEGLTAKVANHNWGHIGYSQQCLQWTDSKTSLVELIYALYAAGVINHGHCEIRELSAFFEQAFNVRFPDIYRTYLEIKIRTIPTKFIDNLKVALLRKMEEDP